MKQKEILSFHNLEGNPFDKEIKTSELIELKSQESAYKSAQLLLDTKGIGVLTGPSGSGKSCLLRKLAADLNPGLYKAFYICHTSLGTQEFYQTLSGSLGLSTQGRRGTVFRNVKTFLSEMNDNKKIHPVLFIDEAHALCSDAMKELRMLTNFDYDSKNACTILLCGQTELMNKLSLNVFTSLANSITYTIAIETLTLEETTTYIESRISATKGNHNLFTASALKLIHDSSGGILRNIAKISWLGLVKAYTHKSPQVEKEHVQMNF